MTDHLIEIIYTDISVEKIGFLLMDLISKGQEIVSYNITFNSPEIDWNVEEIKKIFVDNKCFGLFINLKKLETGQIHLPNCGLAIYKYENTVDLEINFQLSDLENISLKSLGENLMKFAKVLADRYQINLYLCGIEPAHDLQTRLFTNETLGPFSFPDRKNE
jgi:hypothetical protein